MDLRTLIVLSAVAGGSNLGLPLPEKEKVQRLLTVDGLEMERAVMTLWGSYMDSDEMCYTFLSECSWWYADRSNFNRGRSKSADPSYVKRVWPDIARVMGF
jgi:hypothetical protein